MTALADYVRDVIKGLLTCAAIFSVIIVTWGISVWGLIIWWRSAYR